MNSHPKIVFISISNSGGGAETVLSMLAQVNNSPLIFIKKVFENQVSLKPGQNVKFLTHWPLFFGFILLFRELYAYRRGYILISSHSYVNAYLGILKRIRYLQSKLIVRESTSIFTRYSGLKRLTYQIMCYLGYPAANAVICQTEEMKKQLLAHNRFLEPQKVVVKPNPINVEEIRVQACHPITEGGQFICAAGRLIEIKGFHILINAFSQIHQHYPDFKLLILGDGTQKSFLQDLIKQLNLQNKVILKGYISNPYPYFKKADLCVVSSLLEGFPNVLLQMMVLNRRVISTLCANGIEDIPDITKVSTNNAEELALAIHKALATGNKEDKNELNPFLSGRDPGNFLDSLIWQGSQPSSDVAVE